MSRLVALWRKRSRRKKQSVQGQKLLAQFKELSCHVRGHQNFVSACNRAFAGDDDDDTAALRLIAYAMVSVGWNEGAHVAIGDMVSLIKRSGLRKTTRGLLTAAVHELPLNLVYWIANA